MGLSTGTITARNGATFSIEGRQIADCIEIAVSKDGEDQYFQITALETESLIEALQAALHYVAGENVGEAGATLESAAPAACR